VNGSLNISLHAKHPQVAVTDPASLPPYSFAAAVAMSDALLQSFGLLIVRASRPALIAISACWYTGVDWLDDVHFQPAPIVGRRLRLKDKRYRKPDHKPVAQGRPYKVFRS
jgi:hypothetical protein